MEKINLFWFRRDLRLDDNAALNAALAEDLKVLPIFIFDENIITDLQIDDARLTFIYHQLKTIHSKLVKLNSGLIIKKGTPDEVWQELLEHFDIHSVYLNRDYEPYARERDKQIEDLLNKKGISLKSYKDQVIFEPEEILEQDCSPYTIYTPYKNKWLENYFQDPFGPAAELNKGNFLKIHSNFPELEDVDLQRASLQVRDYDLSQLAEYARLRDFPGADITSHLGPHLRFGTVSIREIVSQLEPDLEDFLSELIWREFFMQILYHYPRVLDENFKTEYNGIRWRFCLRDFERWCNGETGYPLVDAGMRQLNETGFMHNRVRMVTASFLCKHLMVDWRWGEDYFADQLLDFELASNNGNWQWSAGTGCDAAPYFQVFNPVTQQQQFDKDLTYVKKWVPEYGSASYPQPIVDQKIGRERAIAAYKEGLARNMK